MSNPARYNLILSSVQSWVQVQYKCLTYNVVQEAVIPAAEWQRIKESLSHREREGQEQCEARQRRKDRKLQSQSIVKHWENTIEVCY